MVNKKLEYLSVYGFIYIDIKYYYKENIRINIIVIMLGDSYGFFSSY